MYLVEENVCERGKIPSFCAVLGHIIYGLDMRTDVFFIVMLIVVFWDQSFKPILDSPAGESLAFDGLGKTDKRAPLRIFVRYIMKAPFNRLHIDVATAALLVLKLNPTSVFKSFQSFNSCNSLFQANPLKPT
ncbi:MAG: hypothetical protein WC323_04395 [Patescibacteria group bacterium]|jgi:hypothetical protein